MVCCQRCELFRFELAGHGSDSARYEETDVNIWKAQLLEVIDDIVKTDVILAGSSLGGWLSLLAALERPEKSKVCWDWLPHPILPQIWKLIFYAGTKGKLYGEGRLEFVNADFTYVFTRTLFETGRQNMLLNRSLPIKCPVHLIQGQKDASLDPKKR